MVQFYASFVPHLAELLNPLYALTRSDCLARIVWTSERNACFQKVKDSLANSTVLVHPSDSARIELVTDASEIAMGGVLNQVTAKSCRLLAFWSKALSPHERKWSCFERELFACYSAIKHFRHFLESRDFLLKTDHKPTVTKFYCNSSAGSPKQTRFFDFISQFTNQVEHVSGKVNVVDALSRPPDHATIYSVLLATASIDYIKLTVEQCSDPEIQELRTANTSALIPKEVPLAEAGVKILCDDSLGKLRPVVPNSMRLSVFHHFQNLSHHGIRGSVRLLTGVVAWKGIKKDVKISLNS